MRQLISQALKTATFRQTIITTISTFASAGLGAVFYLLLARLMSLADYGLFTLATSAVLTAISIADLGTGQSLIRFAGQNREGGHYLPFAHLALRLKILAAAICLAAFFLLARPIAGSVLRQPDLTSLLPLAGLSAFGMLLLSFTADLARGLQKFFLWGGIQVGANLFRLLLLGLLIALVPVTPGFSLIIFAAAPTAAFFVSWAWLDKKILEASISSRHIRDFWAFNKWTAAFIIASALVSRLDTFLSARFLNLSDLGIYGLATTMAIFMPQLSGALGAVTSAKFAGFTDSAHAARYLKKAVLFNAALSVGVAALMIPASLFVIWFTGLAYAPAFGPFLILLAALTIFTSLNPLRDSLFYFHARPDFFFWLAIIQAILVLSLGSLLIPQYGVMGTSLTVLFSQAVLAVVTAWYYRRLTSPSHA